jgi:hypothetical protein
VPVIIVVGNWKKKLVRVAILVLVVALFAAAVPTVSGLLYERVPVFSGWMQDEKPTGNPMRVETNPSDGGFNDKVDQFVVKLQNFYLEEQE